MKRIPSPLKPAGDVTSFQPAPSSLAHGLNLETVVNIQNHWREFYNPLRGISLQRAIALFDFSRRGLNAELQNVYREMEQLFPALIGLIKRRTAQLTSRQFLVKTIDPDSFPDGASQSMADEQAACLRAAYAALKNRREAIKRLFLGEFRGWSHLEKIYKFPGTNDWTIEKLEFVEQWHWTRKSMYAQWEYVPAATQSNCGIAINEDQFVIYQAAFGLDRLALILYIRTGLAEKDWDALCEIYGIPRPGVVMPNGVPKDLEATYLNAARTFAQGGAAALPFGTTVIPQPLGDLKGDIFKARIDHISEMLVLAGTGGRLSMLSAPQGLGSGSGQANEHADAFDEIGEEDAANLSECFQQQFDSFILNREFPDQPRLSYVELAAPAETDTGAVCTEISTLATAGYMVDLAQVEEKTGYKVALKALPPPEPEKGGDSETEIKNRTGGASAASPTLEDSALATEASAKVAAETRDNLSHAVGKLSAVLQIRDDTLRAKKLAALHKEWPGITADTLLGVNTTDLQNTIATAFAAGLQTSDPTKNRRLILNGDVEGHEFHGNQYTGAPSGAPTEQIGKHGDWKSLGLRSAQHIPPDRAVDPNDLGDARDRLKNGFVIKDHQGRDIKFGPAVLQHWESAGKSGKDQAHRLRRLDEAIKTAETPHEVWETGWQRNYVRASQDEHKRRYHVGFVTDQTGEVQNFYHTSRVTTANHLRKGTLKYVRK